MASEFMSERDVGKYIQEKLLKAKKGGAAEVTLVSGDIQEELFLKDGLEEICTAMQKLMGRALHPPGISPFRLRRSGQKAARRRRGGRDAHDPGPAR